MNIELRFKIHWLLKAQRTRPQTHHVSRPGGIARIWLWRFIMLTFWRKFDCKMMQKLKIDEKYQWAWSYPSLHYTVDTTPCSRLVALGAPIPTTQTKNFQAKNIDAPHPPVAKVKGLMMLGLNRFFPWLPSRWWTSKGCRSLKWASKTWISWQGMVGPQLQPYCLDQKWSEALLRLIRLAAKISGLVRSY